MPSKLCVVYYFVLALAFATRFVAGFITNNSQAANVTISKTQNLYYVSIPISFVEVFIASSGQKLYVFSYSCYLWS